MNKKILKILLLSLGLLLLVSCGKKSTSKSSRKAWITEDQINTILDNQLMSCAAIGGGSCPEGVARLFIIDKFNADASTVCSGFMVGPNRMVTNHHCVENTEICSNTYIAIYTSSGPVINRCAKVLESREDYSDSNEPLRAVDYAVIETKEVYNGDFFQLAEIPAEVGDRATAWVVDHTGLDDPKSPNFFFSRITEFDCEVDDPGERASLMLKNCPVISGNSGSPLFNLDGEILGVIWGASRADTSSLMPLSERRSLSAFAAVTETIHFQAAVENAKASRGFSYIH
jgi:V8-like Glu-specific endopeptidase